MAKYAIGFSKNYIVATANNLDEARKTAVKVWRNRTVQEDIFSDGIMRIYKGKEHYADVLVGGSFMAVDLKGNSILGDRENPAYHRDYTGTPILFNPKTGKLR